MEIAGAVKALSWVALAALALWGLHKLKGAGRTEEKLDQAERSLEEAGDAAAIKRVVDHATPDERERLRKRWGGR